MARILITEDEDALRSFVARALRLDGHETHEAADGAEFVADGEQEIVVLVVFRVKQFIRLLDQFAVRCDLLGRRFQLLRAVGHHVQVHRNFCARIEIDAAEAIAASAEKVRIWPIERRMRVT